jgi:hypothetical protein
MEGVVELDIEDIAAAAAPGVEPPGGPVLVGGGAVKTT